MALQLSYTDNFGNTNSAAYLRITSLHIQLGSDTQRCRVDFDVYKDAVARSKADATATKTPVLIDYAECFDSSFATYFADGVLDDNNKSPLKQAYAFLKTLSTPINFSGASDV